MDANDHKIRNVADGVIGVDSLDAVNGRQLWDAKAHLTQNIDSVGAQAAAMANLHPLDYEHSDRVSVSASIGAYKGSTSGAIGAFYRPDSKSLISITGAVGGDNNMYGIGFSKKLGKVSELENLTDEQLKDKLAEIGDENKVIKTKNADLQSELDTVKNDNAGLKEDVSTLQKAYQAVQGQLKALMEKLAGK